MERQCEKSELRKYAESACEWCGEENCITPKSCKRRWEIEMGVAEQPISPLPVVPQSESEGDRSLMERHRNSTSAHEGSSPSGRSTTASASQINAAAARENVDESLEQIATNVHRALKHLQNGNHGWALDWLETADEALQALTKARS